MTGELVVHSVEETEAPLSFTAYLPVGEDEEPTGPLLSSDSPMFDIEFHRSMRTLGLSSSPLPRLSVVKSVEAAPESRIEVVLEGPGSGHAVLMAPSEADEYLSEGTVLLEPERLKKIRGGIILRGIEISFVPDKYQDPWSSVVWLPVARVHRPHRRRCSSVYTVVDSTVAEYDARFSLGGIGGLGGTKFSVQFTESYPATAACKEAKVEARIEIVYGTTVVGGEPIQQGYRVKVTDVKPENTAYEDISAALDCCGWPQNRTPRQGRTLRNLSGATGGKGDAVTTGFRIARETHGTLTVGVDFGRVPATLSISCSRSCAHEVEVQTTLMPGADYLAYRPRPDNLLERCWTVL